jgi:iron complex transport system substrate-binding protein
MKAASLLILCVLVLVSGGCPRRAGTDGSRAGTKAAPGSSTGAQTPPGTPATKVVRDSVGDQITVPVRPSRIVALAPSIVENLFFIGAGSLIVGATTFSNFPAEAEKIPTVGTYSKLDIEKITYLSPDLIVATKDGNEKESVQRLREIGFPVFVLGAGNVDDVINEIEAVADLVGMSEGAAPKVRSLRERLRTIAEDTKGKRRPRVFLQLNWHPLVTAGPGTFADDVISKAGGDNIADARGPLYPVFNVEKVVSLAPEVMIISSMGDGSAFDEIRNEWGRWSSIPAVRKGRVFRVDANLFRPSPRIVDAVELFARWFHGGGSEKP